MPENGLRRYEARTMILKDKARLIICRLSTLTGGKKRGRAKRGWGEGATIRPRSPIDRVRTNVNTSLVLCPINKFTDALEFSEYRVGRSSPDERPFVGVVMSDVGFDLPH